MQKISEVIDKLRSEVAFELSSIAFLIGGSFYKKRQYELAKLLWDSI